MFGVFCFMGVSTDWIARRLTAQSGLTPDTDKTLGLQIRETPGGMLGVFYACFLGENAFF
jgi:hypothetical protein